MDDKQYAEIAFWKDLSSSLGGKKFLAQRRKDLFDKVSHFPEMLYQEGCGVDYGCGLISIFEFGVFDFSIVAYDPLIFEYNNMLTYGKMLYTHDSQVFKDEAFDFVFCVNAMDHTDNPLAMADDIYRILKPGGMLYFEVNFDPVLTAPHYHLWRMPDVEQYLGKFELLTIELCKGEFEGQEQFWGVFKK